MFIISPTVHMTLVYSRARLAFVVRLITGVAGFSAAALAQNSAPSGKWPTASATSLGLNRAVLDSLDTEISAGKYGYVDRMLVIRHGKVAIDKVYAHDYVKAYGDSATVNGALNSTDITGPYNYYLPWWHPYYRRGDLHTLQSVTKTVTSVIIGVAVTRGDFASIDAPVLRYFDTTKVANIDDRKRRMTVRHLLTMSGGFDWNENLPYIDPKNTATALEASPDWVAFTINRPMMREPGTQFNYSSGESVLLAQVFRQATGRDVEEYAAEHLFAPLGITHWYWKRTPSGSLDTEGGLYLEAGDLARIWYLFTQGGMWNGTRVVSADWVHQSVSPAFATGTAPTAAKYGLKWWLHQDPLDPAKFLWAGSGFGGQFPVAFPDLDMVVVFNSWNILPGRGGLPVRKIEERLAHAVVGK
jgi:CubicO group peptidase (beta-lactamase class C family)